jgi:enterochelin esterase-like enzyme
VPSVRAGGGLKSALRCHGQDSALDPSPCVSYTFAVILILVRGTLLTALAVLSLPAAAQTPARSAFDILEVGQWSNPPKEVNPLAAHHTYHSAAMKCDVGYTIYLPPNYAAAAGRYPVVYWLPGGGCTEEPDSLSIAQGLLGGMDAAIRNGKLPALIFVIVNGGRYTRYYDSLDGSIMMETTVIKELIPHIDATCRTVATRDGRAVQGGSMGGMGSLKFAFKYPGLFSSAVAFCPAILDADANMERNPTLIPALFNGDKALFTKDSPAAMLVTNAGNIREKKLAIKIVIGSEDGLLKWTEQLHASMVKLKISHELEIVGGVGHDFGAPATGIYEHQLRALRYAAAHFVPPQP